MKTKKEKQEFSFYEGFKINKKSNSSWVSKIRSMRMNLFKIAGFESNFGHFWTKFKVWSHYLNSVIWILQKFSLYEPEFISRWVVNKKFKNSFSENSQNWFIDDTKYFLSLRHRKCWNLNGPYTMANALTVEFLAKDIPISILQVVGSPTIIDYDS